MSEPVGGIGIKITDEMIKNLIETGAMTEEDWEDANKDVLPSDLFFWSEVAGNSYTDEYRYYLLVPANTYLDVKNNINMFISKLAEYNINITEEDLMVINDVLIL